MDNLLGDTLQKKS